ncbi:MAG: hypothetical protein OXU74_10115 [Gemmatimonadota bacterium]|nr:hypothetical protein [Gemmatimonadota bacterium]
MKEPIDERLPEPQTEPVTYVVVVHGIGEQRKNETAISVVNRFAEARRAADADDNRDVLTLGQACGQTGSSKVPVTEQPWMEFDGIPASRSVDCLEPFLGKQSDTGKNLRFVDLCWSDVMQDSIEQVGQDVDVWVKGLLGRLLRKHKDAEGPPEKPAAKVPLWIRRVLYLLTDALLLVRFGMNFRFKEMKELVFVRFLGDVQLYGEYGRCRGRAVRRFHSIMARIEAEHRVRERERDGPAREARYVILAHSLGSIMSFDALLYASASVGVRRGRNPAWKFPGYLRDDDRVCESDDLSKLDNLREKKAEALSVEERCDLRALENRFTFLDTNWIRRVRSFVTLGSPIDKYLTIWWLNYRYLLERANRSQSSDSLEIAHFNYCDELDPVGHNLDVVQQTPGYRAVFKCVEDVVFNRYAVPGAAHNKYWTDQGLFKRILDRAVDEGHSPSLPWFGRWVYWKLLLGLYTLVPLLILLGTYASLSFAFQADGWRTAALAATIFSFSAYLGRRLIDLSIWWRQIQRQKSQTFWRSSLRDDSERNARRRAARLFRVLVAAVPLAWIALATAALGALTCPHARTTCPPDWSALPGVLVEAWSPRVTLVALVTAAIVVLMMLRRLPAAYRARAVADGTVRPTLTAGLWVLGSLTVGIAAVPLASHFGLPHFVDLGDSAGQVALLGILATAVYAYRLYRFRVVRSLLRHNDRLPINYSVYAGHL